MSHFLTCWVCHQKARGGSGWRSPETMRDTKHRRRKHSFQFSENCRKMSAVQSVQSVMWPWTVTVRFVNTKNVKKLFYPSQHMTVNKPSTNGLLCVSVLELTNVSASWAGERRTCWSRLKVSVSRTNCETESSAVDGYRSRLTSQPLKQKQNCITDHRTSHQTLSSWHHFLQTQSEALKERHSQSPEVKLFKFKDDFFPNFYGKKTF